LQVRELHERPHETGPHTTGGKWCVPRSFVNNTQKATTDTGSFLRNHQAPLTQDRRRNEKNCFWSQRKLGKGWKELVTL